MSLPSQQISAGRLESAYREEQKRLRAAEAIGKIWARQTGLWKDDPSHARVIANRLGWLSVPEAMQKEADALGGLAREAGAAGFRDIVLLGMGGSSLAPEVFSLLFPAPAAGHRFFVVDTTDPAAILGVERAVNLAQTLFVVASKSGKTIETLSQFFHFHQRVSEAGVRPPGKNFVAITDAGSYLDQLAGDYGFYRIFRNPADIGGRYSALSYFGLVPAALWDVDIEQVLDAALEMRAACGPEVAAESNPALELGALLGAAARSGDDKLVLLSTPNLVPVGNWIEQLIAESTGKEGKGIVPVAGGAAPPVEVLAQGCVTAGLVLEGEDDARLRATLADLRQRGAPTVEIRMADPVELGGVFFKWEVATALAGASLGIDPFDEPNVQESKDNTARILDRFQSSGEMPLGTSRLNESGIELYAEGATRGAVSTLRLSEALRTFFGARRRGDYLALLAYVARDRSNAAELDALRALLEQRLGMPVLLGYGPRYMHSIGQLYKGGPPTGMFVVITAESSEDVSIPGAKYSFSQLEMAQALGDLQSLVQRDKPALRLHLTEGAPRGLAALRRAAERGLSASRPAAT